MQIAIELLIRNLSQRDVVTDGEAELLRSLRLRREAYPRGTQFIVEDSRPEWSCLLHKGLAARSVQRANGTRQLTALHIAGDFVDLHGFTLKRMDHGVVALTPCEVVFVRHDDLRSITESAPHLTRLLWLLTTIDAAMQRRMTALLGRHTPMERLGHLLCEMYLRLEAIGLASDNRFSFPVIQTELADILGLSIVHTNRTVQDLRATGLITWEHHDVTLFDFPKLARQSDFDATYLNLFHEPR